jgi:hypothetical protein
MESEIAMESFGSQVKLVSLKISSGFKSFIASLKQKLQSLRKSKPAEDATEAFGFGKKADRGIVKDGDIAATDWVCAHNAELAKKYPITGKEVYIDLNDDSKATQFAHYCAQSMKTDDAWEREVPLMTFQVSPGKNGGQKALVAKMRASWGSMDVVSVGYLTVTFKMPLAELVERLNDKSNFAVGDVALIYHEIWNVTKSADEIADNKVMILCQGTFA